MIVCGFTRVDGLIRTVCQVIPTYTIQEVEQQLVVALEMPEVVLLVVVVDVEVVVVAEAVGVVGAAEGVVDAEVVEVNVQQQAVLKDFQKRLISSTFAS